MKLVSKLTRKEQSQMAWRDGYGFDGGPARNPRRTRSTLPPCRHSAPDGYSVYFRLLPLNGVAFEEGFDTLLWEHLEEALKMKQMKEAEPRRIRGKHICTLHIKWKSREDFNAASAMQEYRNLLCSLRVISRMEGLTPECLKLWNESLVNGDPIAAGLRSITTGTV